MKIAFRADASIQIGTGHVMRCLTLADELRAKGKQCHFISRAHSGHLLEVIRQRGHTVTALPTSQLSPAAENDLASQSAHSTWLGCDLQIETQQTAAILADMQPDWLVVDHYALDQQWEDSLAPNYRRLLVIDDLADRPHRCDLLLDQNLGRQPQDYSRLVPSQCKVLTSPSYALLRPEFALLRPYSLERRHALPILRHLLITMGGVDKHNATGQVLQALKTCALPQETRITVVMGLTAPWLQNIQEMAMRMPWPTEVVVNVNDMAQRMADSDLAIGAAGSTCWERCCLGLPTIMVVLADNQNEAATHLLKAGAANSLAFSSLLYQDIYDQLLDFIDNREQLVKMSACAAAITDGFGVERVAAVMGDCS